MCGFACLCLWFTYMRWMWVDFCRRVCVDAPTCIQVQSTLGLRVNILQWLLTADLGKMQDACAHRCRARCTDFYICDPWHELLFSDFRFGFIRTAVHLTTQQFLFPKHWSSYSILRTFTERADENKYRVMLCAVPCTPERVEENCENWVELLHTWLSAGYFKEV